MSSAKFFKKERFYERGLTSSPVSRSDAGDMVELVPCEEQLLSYRTCCESPGAKHSSLILPYMLSSPDDALALLVSRVCTCVCVWWRTGGGVSVSLRLGACLSGGVVVRVLWGGREEGLGVLKEAGWVISLGAAMQSSLRSSPNKETWRQLHGHFREDCWMLGLPVV